jgi:endonuclease/exonuclease/phosphatase family metal-dependent hydrolase
LDLFLRIISIGAALSLPILYLGAYIDPNDFWGFAIASIFYPLSLLTNIFFSIYWAFRKKWLFLLPMLLILVRYEYVLGYFRMKTPPERGVEHMRISTFNAHEFKEVSFPHSYIKDDSWQELMEEIRPDIWCLQEIEGLPYVKGSLTQSIGLHRAVHSAKAGLAIYSKYQPIKAESFVFSQDNGFQYADFRHENGKIFRIYNTHLLSNQITGMAYKISQGGTVPEKEDMHLFRRMLGKYKQSIKTRTEQAGILAAHLAQSPHPFILCGDLNDTPLSFVYTRLRTYAGDSFLAAGNGIGVTYIGPVKGMRIDYIMPVQAFNTLFCRRYPPGNISDHCPVAADIAWK